MKYINLGIIILILASSSISSGQEREVSANLLGPDATCTLSITVDASNVDWGTISMDDLNIGTVTKRYPASGNTQVKATKTNCGNNDQVSLILSNDGGGKMHDGDQDLLNAMHIYYKPTSGSSFADAYLSSTPITFYNGRSHSFPGDYDIYYLQDFTKDDEDGKYQLILTYAVSP